MLDKRLGSASTRISQNFIDCITLMVHVPKLYVCMYVCMYTYIYNMLAPTSYRGVTFKAKVYTIWAHGLLGL